MIALLTGTVVSIGLETAVIDVNGVGYEINAHSRFLQDLNAGDGVTISIETIVREDFIRLYGFASEAERQCFRILTTVQGVGARHALSILQVLPPADLYNAVAAEDVTAISRAHGVGKKIALRIATELQTKLGALAGEVGSGIRSTTASGNGSAKPSLSTAGKAEDHSIRVDAISALLNLGYDRGDAHRAIEQAAATLEAPTVETLIPAALKELSVL